MLTTRQAEIARFIHVRDGGRDLFIEFDRLVDRLMDLNKLTFSVSKFERMFEEELNKKIINKYEINQATMAAIADYCDKLAIYLAQEKFEIEQGRPEKMKELQKNLRAQEPAKDQYGIDDVRRRQAEQ